MLYFSLSFTLSLSLSLSLSCLPLTRMPFDRIHYVSSVCASELFHYEFVDCVFISTLISGLFFRFQSSESVVILHRMPTNERKHAM